tara:strand:+ start:324 stop:1208 length:885 start_codon:yes stop_codon:yes gene_type:complete
VLSNQVINSYRFASGGDSWSTAYDNSILAGGAKPAWTAHDDAMKFVSGTWSNITALPADRQLLQGGGNSDNGIMIAGDAAGTSYPEPDVYGYDGSSWSALASISHDNMMMAGGGNTTDAFWAGGTYSALDDCQTFNGTTWTTQNTLTHGTRGCIGSGKSDGAWCMGGYAGSAVYEVWNQQWDGTNWSDSSTDCPTARFYSYNGGSGLPTSAIVSQNEASTGGCYMFDGSAFSLTGDTNYNRNYRMVGGDSVNAIKCGGSVDGELTEYYDSSTWQTTGDMTIDDLYASGAGGNTV